MRGGGGRGEGLGDSLSQQAPSPQREGGVSLLEHLLLAQDKVLLPDQDRQSGGHQSSQG